MKALVHGNLIDGTGSDPVADATVVIDDEGRITDVSPGLDPPRGAEVTDLAGRTVMPGLIDCHVHFFMQFGRTMQQQALEPLSFRVLQAAERARATLDAGITSVRDAGATPRGFKMATEQGIIPSPRMKIAVVILSQTGGHGDQFLPSGMSSPLASALNYRPEWPNKVFDGVDEAIKTSRVVLRAGADFLKICTSGGVLSPEDEPTNTQFTRQEIAAVVQEAEAKGTYVAAHAQGLNGIKNAVECGVRTIEHGIYLDEETADRMVKDGVFLVPTLQAPQAILDAEEARPGSFLPQAIRKAREVSEVHRQAIRMAVEKGVKVAMGTDAGVGVHGTNAQEVTNLVKFAGMSPMQAIVASTKTAAECSGTEQHVGTLEPGKLADLLVVDGDPLDDISILEDQEKLLMVMQGGRAHRNAIEA